MQITDILHFTVSKEDLNRILQKELWKQRLTTIKVNNKSICYEMGGSYYPINTALNLHKDGAGSFSVKTNFLLEYINQPSVTEKLEFFIPENILSLIHPTLNFGQLSVQRLQHNSPKKTIELFDYYLVEEVHSLLKFDGKEHMAKTIKKRALEYTLDNEDLDLIAIQMREEISGILKGYYTSVELVETEMGQDIKYIIEQDDETIKNMKEDLIEEVLFWYNQFISEL